METIMESKNYLNSVKRDSDCSCSRFTPSIISIPKFFHGFTIRRAFHSKNFFLFIGLDSESGTPNLFRPWMSLIRIPGLKRISLNFRSTSQSRKYPKNSLQFPWNTSSVENLLEFLFIMDSTRPQFYRINC